MTQKIQAEMSTDVALNTLKASQSLKSLNAVISSTKNAWKSQEVALKSTGEYLKAAEVRYKGLGDSIKAQEAKIESLREKQKGLDVTTKDGAASYLKYQKDIDSATTQLKSMEAQQTRAKTSLEYQKSGLASLRTEYKQITTVSSSYVERLKAEGKQQEANKAQMTGYKDSISNLNKQLSAQEKELSRIATASGKDSDAWRTQKVRVDETATALAKTKTSMSELDGEMKKANPSVFTRIKTAIEGTNKQAEKTHSLFKSIFASQILSNALSSAWSAITSRIGEAAKAGMEYEKEQDQMNAVWLTLTGNATKGRAMVDMTNQLSVAFGQSTDLVNELNQQFYHVLDNEPATKKLTTAVLTMGDAVGLSGDNLKNLGLNFTHMMSSSLLQLGDFNHITDALPMYGEALLKYEQKVQKNSKLTMADLRKEMSAGKISAKDAEVVMEQLGDKYHDASENLMKTIPGMERVITSRMPALIGDIEKPLMSMQNPILGAISKWAQDKRTDSEFTKLGKAVSGGLTTITGAFGKAFNLKNGTKVLDNMMANLTKGVTSISKVIANHAPQIKTFFETIKETSKTTAKLSWTALTSALKLLNPLLKTLGDWADKHPKLFGDLAGGFLAVNLAGKVLPIKALLGFANGMGSVYSAVKKLATGNLMTKAMGKMKDFGSSKLGTATAVVTIAYDAISDIKDLTKAFGKSGTVGQKFKAVGETAGTAIGGGIGFFFGGPLGAAVGASIGKVVGGWAGDATKKFTDGWNAKAKPKDWLGKLGFDAHKGATGIAKWWRGIQTQNAKSTKAMEKQQIAANKKSKKDWDGFWSGVGKGWSNFWSNYAKKEKKNQADAKKRQDAQNKAISKAMSSWWSSVTKGWSNFWSGIGKWATQGLTNLQKGFTSKLNSIHKGWNSIWASVGKFFSNLLSGIKNTGSSALGWLGSKFSSGLSSISRGWSRAWNGMSKMFRGIWSGIKSAARTGLNGVIGIINGAIGGINWVWQKFTGHNAIKKIQKLAQGGIVGNMHVVMVNDGTGPDWKELYQLPNGQYGMMKQRNAVMMAPEGTRVWNGKETKSIMQMAGIQHYANGGIVGAVGNFFKVGWDKATAIGDWLKHPIANMTKAVKSAVSGMTASTSMFTSLGKGIVSKMVSGVSAWAQKQLKKLEDTLSPAEPSGSGVQRWKPDVLKALEKLNLSTSAAMVAKVLTQIKTESGGNAKAMGGTDGLNDGHAEGLMQVKPGTFAAYSLKGHGNIWNGYDNMLAGLNYAKHRYGSSLSFLGQGHGYANGGLVNGAAYRLTGEAGPEMVVPLSASKASRAWQLLGQAVQTINKNQASQVQLQPSADNSDIIAAINALGVLLTKLSFNVQIGDDQFYPKVAPKVKAYNDRQNSFRTSWQD
ncbi:tape measure protein [Lacticaseibacillus jixiensis]|uniref:tape measure protein n=1 Tax=Lacticaseibacillus jixiensis TaxID=3231926 RepID=UPI0036F36504